LDSVSERNPALVREAAEGRTQRAIRAMQVEAEIRTDPSLRADRFVKRWQELERQRAGFARNNDWQSECKIRNSMGAMAKSLERDPQMADAGALGQGQDALFDQDASHEFFAHELGHVLGLDHPFGFIDGRPTEYADYYCLMGWTGPITRRFYPPHQVPTLPRFFRGRQNTRETQTIFGARAVCRRLRPFTIIGKIFGNARTTFERLRALLMKPMS
jgi:hypothetical protein